jgi:hypothetical protein
MSEERRRKQIERMVQQAASPKNKTWVDRLVLPFVLAGIAAIVTLYVSAPEVEPKSVFITCSICDDPEQIHPPMNANDNGAVISLVVENTGGRGTTLLDHNMTFRMEPGEQSARDLDFSETADPNDAVGIGLGAHSSLTFASRKNEAIIYDMRHGARRGSSISKIEFDKVYLYGHVTYRGAFYFPATTHFCFEYSPPAKGLPESWGVCSRKVSELVKSGSDG